MSPIEDLRELTPEYIWALTDAINEAQVGECWHHADQLGMMRWEAIWLYNTYVGDWDIDKNILPLGLA